MTVRRRTSTAFADYEAKISIATGDLLGGHLPQAKLTAVRNWLAERRSEIAFCWQEIRAGRPWSIERK
ncbi:DUF4160 domain-containing protein [Prosthecomicrobium pneumaticum]|uniref:DUF4160 domain-containing protein n=1 Tax=Prosthecomicrobium pneumaticum TaxID=81895 RepID=A0A7W9FMY3_9HYPH|nr:DUF4160 domain-containing protein [Prosthecomicrobium pneumaticum]MBB5753615.1 hypothetical protein [Prosthecomicrobium pneumaticum]